MNKARSRAYRLLMSGARYHAPNISRLTIGYRRGTLKALYNDFRDLCRQIQRTEKCPRIEYFATWVCNTTDEGMRRHAHVIWTSPITRSVIVRPIFQEIVGDNATCWIDELQEVSQHKIGYCLQYCARQKGESVRYSKSAGWLPTGYDAQWEAIKDLHRGMIQSEEKKTTLIDDLNNWIDIQRLKRRDTTVQAFLTDRIAPVAPAERPSDGQRPFIKRRL